MKRWNAWWPHNDNLHVQRHERKKSSARCKSVHGTSTNNIFPDQWIPAEDETSCKDIQRMESLKGFDLNCFTVASQGTIDTAPIVSVLFKLLVYFCHAQLFQKAWKLLTLTRHRMLDLDASRQQVSSTPSLPCKYIKLVSLKKKMFDLHFDAKQQHAWLQAKLCTKIVYFYERVQKR